MLNPSIMTDYLGELQIYFHTGKLSAIAIKVYYTALKDWDDSEFISVCEQIMENELFFPKIPTFKEYYAKMFAPEFDKYLPLLAAAHNIPVDCLNIPTAVKNALKSVPNWRVLLEGSPKQVESVRIPILLALAKTQKLLESADKPEIQLIEDKTYWFGEVQVKIRFFDDRGRATVQYLETKQQFLLNPYEFHLLTEFKNLNGQKTKLFQSTQPN